MQKIFNIFSQIFDDEDFFEVTQEQDGQNNDEKNKIEQEFAKKIEDVLKIRIPCDKEELLHLLSELSIQVKTNRWYRNREKFGKIKNNFSDTLFEKYRQCVYKLEILAPESQLHYYKNILKKQLIRRYFQKNRGFFKRLGIIILLFVFVLILLKFTFSFVGNLFWIAVIVALFIIGFIIIRKDQDNVKYIRNQDK